MRGYDDWKTTDPAPEEEPEAPPEDDALLRAPTLWVKGEVDSRYASVIATDASTGWKKILWTTDSIEVRRFCVEGFEMIRETIPEESRCKPRRQRGDPRAVDWADIEP